MPILPLPQFEADIEEDRKIYEGLKLPTSVVVRFGAMKLIGEFPYSGDVKPGCGTKFVVRTHRGTELGEMLTSTCPNAGCSKSVTRKEMLEYIENSGGRDYPFFNQGKVVRIATVEDLNEQARLEAQRPQMIHTARAVAERLGLPIKVVDAEPLLGQERLTFHFTSEQRVDFRDLVGELVRLHHARIEMHQVGARDEARLTADYERCGQHCCCKQFLKVLKPVSMKQAKIQKATLDPLKISGRCGRLMCCLRYEEQTYDELRARLPRKKTRVQTPHGWATVLDTQILTQLALVQLDSTGEQVAVPIEDFIKGGTPPPPPPLPSSPRSETTTGPGRPEGQRPSRRGPDRPPVRPPAAPPPHDGDDLNEALVDDEPDDVGGTDKPPAPTADTQSARSPRAGSTGDRPHDSLRGPPGRSHSQQQRPRGGGVPGGGSPDRPREPNTGDSRGQSGQDGQPSEGRRRRRRRRGRGGGASGGGGGGGSGRGPSGGGPPPPNV